MRLRANADAGPSGRPRPCSSCSFCLQEGSVDALRADWPVLTVAMQSGNAFPGRRQTQRKLHFRAVYLTGELTASDGRIVRPLFDAVGASATSAFPRARPGRLGPGMFPEGPDLKLTRSYAPERGRAPIGHERKATVARCATASNESGHQRSGLGVCGITRRACNRRLGCGLSPQRRLRVRISEWLSRSTRCPDRACREPSVVRPQA